VQRPKRVSNLDSSQLDGREVGPGLAEHVMMR
jgi:hypothetical protein